MTFRDTRIDQEDSRTEASARALASHLTAHCYLSELRWRSSSEPNCTDDLRTGHDAALKRQLAVHLEKSRPTARAPCKGRSTQSMRQQR